MAANADDNGDGTGVGGTGEELSQTLEKIVS